MLKNCEHRVFLKREQFTTYGFDANMNGVLFTTVTPHVKTAWVEVVAATEFYANGIALICIACWDQDTYLIDVGIGAAGSEVVLLPNVYYANYTNYQSKYLFFPVKVPKGSRIAVRLQGNVAAHNIRAAVALSYIDNMQSFNKVYDCGSVTASSTGTGATSGGSANTYGSYVELIASTPANFKAFKLVFGSMIGGWNDANYLYDIAVGAAGSEVVVAKEIYMGADQTSGNITPYDHDIPIYIPQGSRIAMRVKGTIASRCATRAILYGMVA